MLLYHIRTVMDILLEMLSTCAALLVLALRCYIQALKLLLVPRSRSLSRLGAVIVLSQQSLPSVFLA